MSRRLRCLAVFIAFLFVGPGRCGQHEAAKVPGSGLGQGAAKNAGQFLPLPAGAIARLGEKRFRVEDSVHHLRFLPGDRHLLAAWGKVNCFWDLSAGREDRRLSSGVPCTALSPDGKLLAAVETDGVITLLNVATGKESHRLLGASQAAKVLAWSHDGRLLAAAIGASVLLWDTTTGNLLGKLKADCGNLLALAFAPRTNLLAGGDDRCLQIWKVGHVADSPAILDPLETECITLEGALQGNAPTLAFSLDAKILTGPCYQATGKNTGRVGLRQWDTATGKKIRDLDYGTFNCVAGSPDGKIIASGDSRLIRLWDPGSGREIRQWIAHSGQVVALAFSRDGKSLASAGLDRVVRVWDPAAGKECTPSQGHIGPVQTLAFAPDGNSLASGGQDRTLRFWNWVKGQEIRPCFRVDSEWGVGGLAYAADGKTLLTAETGVSHTVFRLWQWGSGQQLTHFAAPMQAGFFALAPGARKVVAGDSAGKLSALDANPWQLQPLVGEPCYRLKGVSVSFDGTRAAWITEHYFGVRNLLDGKDLFWKREEIAAAAFSPDGTTIATAQDWGHVRLWDAVSGRLLADWKDMTNAAAVVFSADGRLLAAANAKGPALWEIAVRQEVRRFAPQGEKITALALAPHGRVLASAQADGSLLAWDITGRLQAGKLLDQDWREEELLAYWHHLKSTNSARAHDAIWALAAAGQKPLPFLEKILLVPDNAQKKIQALLADLAHDSFPVRDKALRELASMGQDAELALQAALAATPPLEVARRLEILLSKLDKNHLADKSVQVQRALAVLEYSGTKEARLLLDRLAAGPPAGQLTRDARPALRRLGHE